MQAARLPTSCVPSSSLSANFFLAILARSPLAASRTQPSCLAPPPGERKASGVCFAQCQPPRLP